MSLELKLENEKLRKELEAKLQVCQEVKESWSKMQKERDDALLEARLAQTQLRQPSPVEVTI